MRAVRERDEHIHFRAQIDIGGAGRSAFPDETAVLIGRYTREERDAGADIAWTKSELRRGEKEVVTRVAMGPGVAVFARIGFGRAAAGDAIVQPTGIGSDRGEHAAHVGEQELAVTDPRRPLHLHGVGGIEPFAGVVRVPQKDGYTVGVRLAGDAQRLAAVDAVRP